MVERLLPRDPPSYGALRAPTGGDAGTGVCGFHHCPVFLGADGEPARATVVNHDRRLTGGIGTEICDATGTHLVAMPEQTWSEALCSLLDVPRRKLPGIGQPDAVAGHLSKEAAEETGLRFGTPVVYDGGDSHCALVGLGVVGSGEAGLLLGTNSTLTGSAQRSRPTCNRKMWPTRPCFCSRAGRRGSPAPS
jgi:hypothetical protein